MKRRVIRQGEQSLTVTLPIQWIRERGIEEGEEIEVVPSGDFLIIGSRKVRSPRRIALSVKGVNEAIKKLLASLYRNGYEEICLSFDSPEISKYIQEMVFRELVGYQVIKLHETQYLIKSIADLDPESFDILFKNCFLQLLHFVQEVVYGFQLKDWKVLEQAIPRDIEINKLTNLCTRLLNQKMNDRRKIAILATTLKGMEYVGDELKEMVAYYLQQKRFPSRQGIALLEELVQHFQKIHLFYQHLEVEKLLGLNDFLRQQRESLGEQEDKDGLAKFLKVIYKQMELLLEGPLVLQINQEEKMRKEDWIV